MRPLRLYVRVRVLHEQEAAPGGGFRFGSIFHAERNPVAAAGEPLRIGHRVVHPAVEGLVLFNQQLFPLRTRQEQLRADKTPALFQFVDGADGMTAVRRAARIGSVDFISETPLHIVSKCIIPQGPRRR